MDYVDEYINKDKEQKEKIIAEYNKVRESIDSKTFLDTLIELPPKLNFYVIKTKIAKLEDYIPIRDYINWYKYFYKVDKSSEIAGSLRNSYNELLYTKYLERSKIDEKHLDKLSESAVELIKDKEYAKKHPQLVKTIVNTSKNITEKAH